MIKNEEITSTVIGYGMDGEGVLKEEDKTVFVPFAIKDEKITYKVLKVSGNCAFGKVESIISPSVFRVEAKCPVFKKCGGCDLQHIEYNEQLRIKENKIKNCFSKIANLDVEILDTVKNDNPFRYRNKLQLPVGVDGVGNTVIGFYARSSHRIIEINDCLINPSWSKNVISAFKRFIKEFNLSGYNETTGKGDIREITAKEIDDKLIIAVVTPKKHLNNLDRLIEILKEELSNTFSLFLNYNESKSNAIFGNDFELIYGEKEYFSEMLGIKYGVGVRSFMQVNRGVCKKLYSEVNREASLDNESTIIDAYSGAGLMTCLLAKNAKKAIGVEIVSEAVDMANKLAKLNGLDGKVTNFCGKCEDLLPNIIEKEKKLNNKTVLVLDPPRKGCEMAVISAVIKSGIDKIIYVSCKPSTLARDVGLIVGSLCFDGKEVKRVDNFIPKYKIKSITPFDMFSETKHVESLCVLDKII